MNTSNKLLKDIKMVKMMKVRKYRLVQWVADKRNKNRLVAPLKTKWSVARYEMPEHMGTKEHKDMLNYFTRKFNSYRKSHLSRLNDKLNKLKGGYVGCGGYYLYGHVFTQNLSRVEVINND